MDPQWLSSQQFIWLLFLSVPLLLLFKNSGRRAQGKLPPGPWKLPIVGNLHQLGSKPHDSLHKLSVKHGPLMFLKLGSIPTVIISSADIAQEVFKFHDAAFSNRPNLYASRKITYGLDMAWTSYGEYWRQLRKVSMKEVLSLKRVESFRAVREDEVASLIAYIRRLSASSPSCTVNLSEVMLTLVNNIVCRIMFGDKYRGRISKYDDGGSRFYEILDETMKLLGGFCVADYFPSLEWIHAFTGLKKRVDKNFEELDSFFNEMIQEQIDEGSDPDHQNLVHVLLWLHKDPTYSATFSTMNNIKAFLSVSLSSTEDLVWCGY